uniref:Uncharacterized protein n=1 Tax=Avena sativa TaxID=4498 RepID=A0ACD5YZW1_AVESA
MSKSLSEAEPCPGRILLDAGGGFAVGALGGSVFHFIKGSYNSPHGARFTGGMQALRMNAPRVGGSLAVWGGVFSTFNCAAVYVRQKEDPWNSIFSGAATGGLLAARRGLRAAGRSALFGGAILALIEGMGIVANRVLAAQAEQNRPAIHDTSSAAIANRLHAAQQDLPQVDDPILFAGVTNRVDDPDLAAAVANRVHAAQQNQPPVDDPAFAAGGGDFQGFGKKVEETK